MISCQRHLFSIPEKVTYLNCAFTAPLLDAAQAAGRSALQAITAAIAERAGRLGLKICPANLRSPHLIGLTLRDGKAKELAAQLAAENIFVSVRGNSIRIAPHLYNTHADIDRLFSVLEASLR